MKNGTPWDVAFSMKPHWRQACAIAFRELEGSHELDWHTLEWREVKR